MAPTTRSSTKSEITTGNDTNSTPDTTRLRQKASNMFPGRLPKKPPARDESTEPPHFTIDLSLPPEQRYLEVCAAFEEEITGLTSLFDEVVGGMVRFISLGWLHFICRLLLRRVHNYEENAELKGISKASGVPMYLLVCFNTLLDLLMGCSSGGAIVRGNDDGTEAKMVHFRTLDWGMPALRRVVVHLDFVDVRDGPVIASTITYAGFVGVLTGVRKDLSMSLNFRPNRIDNGVFWADVKYIWHLLMVLLGQRPSISSTLRGLLLPQNQRGWRRWFSRSSQPSLPTYATIISQLSGKSPPTTTACYLCFSSGSETTVVEKDRISAIVRSSQEFSIVTNADESSRGEEDSPKSKLVEVIVTEAEDRQECALHNWTSMRARKAQRVGLTSEDDPRCLMEMHDVVEMVQKYPTTNEMTHYACVMDPMRGEIVWCVSWADPVSAKWIRAHMSDTW